MVAQLRPSRVERQRIDNRNARFDSDRRGISESHTNINLDGLNLTQKDLYNFLKKTGSILKGDFVKRKQPAIPYVALYLALIKDLLDVAQISGVGLLVTIPISIIASGGLIYWMWGKTSFRAWKEKLLRWLMISIIIEIFPGTSLIPATLILVLIVHYNETKIIRLINLSIDYLEKGGVLDR